MTFILPIISLLWSIIVFFIIFFIVMETKKAQIAGKNPFLRLYFLLISIIAICWATISLWFIIYPTIQKILITDREYSVNQREYKNCSEANYSPKALPDGTYTDERVEKTDDEITSCQQQSLLKLAESRYFQYKETLTVAISRFLIFAILFSVHFPIFIRHNKD